ncbi:Stk1 family PASTA domain-containing Ser/Thr kinase [Thermoanaerobacterium sp. DL9XJH110]|uniref:Stk1 family PASTA domain-containing Ser/Thr kinase n=1 Tax=Thermoanaerobacterium sp. DL9XJH110 TaxID=3386643 RepID=UPI003BB4F066
MIGKILGNRYTILEEIGGGGMAVVYKARCNLLNRVVAIKVLRSEFSGDEEFVRRFRREAQAAASLSHPNIVSIYDVGQEDGSYYIVMEYVEGKTLKDLIRQEAPMPPVEVVEIGRQICDALECAHKNKIIHRDIKSHNIIITPEGRVKVTDFGIARAVTGTTITHTGDVFGSVHYFSPEQARGDVVDERSDIYSVGIILYEALTGRLPFDGQTPVAVALKHIQESPEPISGMIRNFPGALEAIVTKCLAKSPDERFQSAGELKMALTRASSDPEVMGFKSSELERTLVLNKDSLKAPQRNSISGPPGKKKRGILRSVAAGVLLVMLFGVFSYFGAALARRYFEVPEVIVPNVIGLSEEDAAQKLRESNLKYVVADRIYDSAPAGQVIDQDPKGGEKVKINHPPINLVVSKGPKTRQVPKIVGLSEADGITAITQGNFKVGTISREYSDEYPEGIIMDQNPREGLILSEGTSINFTVSLGPEVKQTNVPILIGKTYDEARSILAEQKMKVGNVVKKSSDVPENTVIEQNPRPGEAIGPDGTVDLVISSGPPKVKSFNLELKLPSEPPEFTIKAEVSDDLGQRVVYNKKHTPQDSPLIIPIEGAGVIHVKVWLDDILIYDNTH